MPRFALRWWGLGVVICATLVDLMNNQIVTVALPVIHNQLGGGEAALQWISAGYALALALTLITGGRLGDRYGVKRLFLTGLVLFTIVSLAAGLAPNVGVLIAARVLQGISSGLMVPQVLSYIYTEFPEEERTKATAFYTASFTLGNIAGPLLGSALTQGNLFGTSWRAIFLINVPLGVLVVAGIVWTIPARKGALSHRIDSRGLVLLVAALFALFYPLVQGRELGWPVWVIVLFVAAIPLFWLFARQQRAQSRRGGEPLIPPTLLRYRTLRSGLAILFTLSIGMGVFFVLNLHLQLGLGYPPLLVALVFLLPGALGTVASNFAAVRLAKRFGQKPVVTTGVVLALAGLAALAVLVAGLGSALAAWVPPVPTFVFGLGIGAVMNLVFTLSLAEVVPEEAGAASGLVGTNLQLGTASGIAVSGTVFFSLQGSGSATATAVTIAVSVGVLLITLLAAVSIPKGAAAGESLVDSEQHGASAR
ncbi:MFS transporter [Amycolatopsis sp. NPDC059027]|uniref:MFS transporter n=1 Tax=Amycolatopsis sp. NPDC059027 TaxID=3346709 RepID=UPI00366B6D60